MHVGVGHLPNVEDSEDRPVRQEGLVPGEHCSLPAPHFWLRRWGRRSPGRWRDMAQGHQEKPRQDQGRHTEALVTAGPPAAEKLRGRTPDTKSGARGPHGLASRVPGGQAGRGTWGWDGKWSTLGPNERPRRCLGLGGGRVLRLCHERRREPWHVCPPGPWAHLTARWVRKGKSRESPNRPRPPSGRRAASSSQSPKLNISASFSFQKAKLRSM